MRREYFKFWYSVPLILEIFRYILIEINTFSFKKMHLNMSAKWRLFHLGLNESRWWPFSEKPLLEPMVIYYQLYHWEQISGKLKSKYNKFHSRKCFENVVCKTATVLLTLNVRGPSHLSLTRSISWLLMPWLLTSPGHQQPWYIYV